MNNVGKAVKISDNVYWVGAVDWTTRDFHGYQTSRGTTYNAYLIMADKITLVDTVKTPFMGELLSRISSVVDPSRIDYIVSNHAEMDHSGCLPQIMDIVKPEKVFASAMGQKILESQLRIGSKITPVMNGENLSLGNMNLTFIETKMLHWPDSMFSYLKEEQILFSQDAFGMHLAVDRLFDDENVWDVLEEESEKYFANILMPYSNLIIKLLDAVGEMKLPIKLVATDHGPIWRSNIGKIIELYRKWSEHKPVPRAVVVYDTMWNSTASMANAIGEGLRESGVDFKILPMSVSHRSDVATEILKSSAIIVGSPTLNNNIFPTLADVLTYVKGLRPLNMVGASFSSYGWSGESLGQLNDCLKAMNVELVNDGIRVKYVPADADLNACMELGRLVGTTLRGKIINLNNG
ncbi:MAG TPA: MBL fold metallo-hydrolase [Lentisphaeria bacterium]|nr:MAG: MBL fold metallo-hydrolase [Lentisphaerae bacterium GWF2_50_93]HCE44106.1 MBL fold metallo-hydrolase [Lentisphaeria bacterium]